MNSLRSHLHDYLRIRRGLGFELKATEWHLERFVAFCEQAGAGHITVELALAWAGCRPTRTDTNGAGGLGWYVASPGT